MQKISPETSSTIPIKMSTTADNAESEQVNSKPNMTSIEVEVNENELPPTTKKPILNDDNADNYSCYTACCDIIGNRQTRFIERLRPLRTLLAACSENLLGFRFDYERDNISAAQSVADELQFSALAALDEISTDSSLNIRAEERVALRMVRQDLSLLHRFILNMINENANNQSFTNSDKQLLLETIHRNCDALAQFLHWIDQKTERRWWLKDLINFLQMFIKLALFISASASVAYRNEPAAPIVTLSITILQGVVEILDQFFIRNAEPNQIRVSIVSNKTIPPPDK